MTDQESDVVTGTVYGSPTGLVLGITLPILCVAIPLSVLGAWSWVAPVVVVALGLVVAPWLRRNSTLTVSDEGVTLLRAGRLAFVPWSNVASLSAGWFPSLVFRQPQRMAWRRCRHLRFGGFDRGWRTRPITEAISVEFARSRTELP